MGEILRHKKTGGLYEVLFRGLRLWTTKPLVDYDHISVVRHREIDRISACAHYLTMQDDGGRRFADSYELILQYVDLQTKAPLGDGANVVIYRSLDANGMFWCRPTSEMDDGRFEPAVAPQPPSPTPGGADALRQIAASSADKLSSLYFKSDRGSDAREAALAGITAITTLLSRISTAGRGEEAAYEELDAIGARVQQGWDADESLFDAARLRWLEKQARKSRTGISFDWVPPVEGERSGFRFMRRFFVTEQCDTLKAAIDRAMLEDPEHLSDRKIDPAAESARLVAAITEQAPGPLMAEIAEGRAAHRRALAARLQHRLDAMTDRGMESVGISKGFAAELVHALSADATNPQDQE